MAHILIADDSAAVVDVMATMLTEVGHRVTKTYSGLEALKTLGVVPYDPAAELPDLLVLDIRMPNIDGQTLGILIRNCERTRAIPILVVTGLEKTALQEMCQLLSETVHVEGILCKPVSADNLTGSVAAILANRKATPPA